MSPYRVVRQRSRWTPCDQCEGAVATERVRQCLRHLAPSDRAQALAESAGRIDARGVAISAELLDTVLTALTAVEPARRHLLLGWAVFTGEADFSGVEEIGELDCSDARFARAATFRDVTFHGGAAFRRTQFVGRLDCSGGRFRGPCTFKRADFLDESILERREASQRAIFEQATFVGPARFREARFWADVSFMMAQFRGPADFRQTRFAGDSRYRNARFESGPPLCDNLARFNEGWWPGKNLAAPGTAAVHQQAPHQGAEPRREPKVFISSSMSGLPMARAFQLSLEEERDIGTIFWRQAFGPSKYNLENLEKVFASIDFGVFLLAPDDLRFKGGTTEAVPRDNVIFEVGMSIGRLGIDRTFMLVPRDIEVTIPTDLAGLSIVEYSHADALNEPEQAMGAAAAKIRMVMRRVGLRPTV